MLKKLFFFVLVLVALVAAYVWLATKWSFSSGERAGWVQKFSNKGWLCKTWEGELAMVAMPGAAPEKFYFTVHDDAVAEKISKAVGKRVALHYEEKVGLPTSCFGDTRHFVTGMSLTDEVPLGPGVVVPIPAPATVPATPAATAPAAPAMTPTPAAAPVAQPAPTAAMPAAPATSR